MRAAAAERDRAVPADPAARATAARHGGTPSNGDGKPSDPPERTPDGVPTKANPTLTIADFGPAPIGVPSFLIDQFAIPPFLLDIYQACGTQYGIPWEVLAAINRIETAFGTNLNVSTAGAVGWMQFMPSTWEAYGTDANGDQRKDPYNPSTRSAPPRATSGRRAAPTTCGRRSSPTTTPTGTSTRCCSTRAVRQAPGGPARLDHRPDPGRPLPCRRQGPLRGRHLRAPGREARRGRQGPVGHVADVSPARRPAEGSTSTRARTRRWSR